jgi:hypothetical protein
MNKSRVTGKVEKVKTKLVMTIKHEIDFDLNDVESMIDALKNVEEGLEKLREWGHAEIVSSAVEPDGI